MGLYCADARVRPFNKHVSCPLTQSQKQIHRLQKRYILLSKPSPRVVIETPISREEVLHCNSLMIKHRCHTRTHAGVAAANRGAKYSNFLQRSRGRQQRLSHPNARSHWREGLQRAICSPNPLKRRPSPTHLLPQPAPQTQAEQVNPAKCQPPPPGHLPLLINLTFHNLTLSAPGVYSATSPQTRHMKRSHQTRGVCPRQQPQGLPASMATEYQTSYSTSASV